MASAEVSRQSSVVSRSPIDVSGQRSIGTTVIAVYVIIVSVAGFVLAVSHFLGEQGTGSGLHLSVFHIYLYGVSILFLVYLQLGLLCRRNSSADSVDDEVDGLPEISVAEDGSAVISLNPVSSSGKDGDRSTAAPANGDIDRSSVDAVPRLLSRNAPYNHEGTGLNLFLRLGLIVFSMGAVVLDAFRLLQFIETETAIHCYGHHFMIHTILRLVFLFGQTFFIFKNHKLVLNFQRAFMKWGLMHVVATNLSIWTSILVMETAESYAHLAPLPQAVIYNGMNSEPAIFNVTRICHEFRSLADQASPFLYPCSIQACLVAAVGLFRIYKNVTWELEDTNSGGWQPVRHGGICHKANTGLFMGLFLIVAAAVSACFCLLHHNDASPLTHSVTILIYASSHIFILAAALLAVILGFCRVRTLTLGRNRGVLNQGLLLFSLAGHYALLGFTAIPIISSVMTFKDQPVLEINLLLFSCLELSIVALSIIESTLQVVLVVIGLRMRATDRRQIKTKPGRSTLTFLMLANVALWLVSTFEVQEIHSEWSFRDFYGELPWQIIVHAFLPLTNLFRFQSAVCLSSVWFNAYRIDQKLHGKEMKEMHESQNLL